MKKIFLTIILTLFFALGFIIFILSTSGYETNKFNEIISSKISKNNKNISTSDSIKDFLREINEKSEVHWLWKWFLALAIVSLLLEILILKFFKS